MFIFKPWATNNHIFEKLTLRKSLITCFWPLQLSYDHYFYQIEFNAEFGFWFSTLTSKGLPVDLAIVELNWFYLFKIIDLKRKQREKQVFPIGFSFFFFLSFWWFVNKNHIFKALLANNLNHSHQCLLLLSEPLFQLLIVLLLILLNLLPLSLIWNRGSAMMATSFKILATRLLSGGLQGRESFGMSVMMTLNFTSLSDLILRHVRPIPP